MSLGGRIAEFAARVVGRRAVPPRAHADTVSADDRPPKPIAEEVMPAGAPARGAPRLPPPPRPEAPAARADAASEYVASGWRYGVAGDFPALPQWVDDLDRAFPRVYEDMMLDGHLRGCVEASVGAALAQGVELRPAVEKEDQPGYAAAVKIKEAAERLVLDSTSRPVEDVLREMLTWARALGHRVAEQTFEPVESGPDAGKLRLLHLKPKPSGSTAFVVDRFLNVHRLWATLPGEGGLGSPGALTAESMATDPHAVPRQKFAVLTWAMSGGDPRGNSDLRQCYSDWWHKRQLLGELLKHLAQFGSPTYHGTTAEGAVDEQATDDNGNPTGPVITPAQKMLSAIMRARNGSAIVTAFGSKLQLMQSSAATQGFLAAIDARNVEIARRLMGAQRAVMEAKHGSKADSESAQDVTGNLTRWAKLSLGFMLTWDVLYPWCVYNYGKAKADLYCPRASLSPTEHQDVEQLSVFATAFQVGLIKPSQLPAVWERFGLPAADPNEGQEQGQPGQEGAPPGGPAPGGPGGAPSEGTEKPTPGGAPANATAGPGSFLAGLQQAGFSADADFAAVRSANAGKLATGTFTDTRGRMYCLDKGKRTKCAPGATSTVPGAGAAARPTVDSAAAHIAGLDRATLTPDVVKQTAEMLTKMTVADLQKLKAKLGLKASGNKDVLAQKLAERALAQPAPPAPVPPPPPPAPPPPPSVLYRGANVITGGPSSGQQAGSPVVPFKDEIEWTTGKPEPGTLNGVAFGPAPPKFWEKVKDRDIGEPPPLGKVDRVGIMIQEPDGRVWIVRPTNGFGNRKYTMPGGGVEAGLSDQQNALKEVWEETGLQVEIIGHLGDFQDANNGNNGRLYVGRRVGGAPWDAKVESFIIDQKTGNPAAESSEVVLVTPERAAKLLHRTDDLAQLMSVAPVPVDTATRGKGSEPLKKFVAAIQPAAQKWLADKKAAGSSRPGTAELHVVQEMRGFNKPPKVVSKKDMDALVAQGGHVEMLRGVMGFWTPKGRKTGADLADEFRQGEHYPGHGVFGSGTYADSTRGSGNAASQYSGANYGGSGAILRMALPSTAKIIKQSELEKMVPANPTAFQGYANSGGKDPSECWLGVQAALAGYDAIEVDGNSSRHGSYGKGFYVVLNRGALVVQQEDATGHVIQ